MKEKEIRLRPQFHITADKGWINDPNGLVFFKGEYHVFFQHYPHDVHWGPMHWGHVVSDDLKHWRRLPIALYPDQPYDQNGCFSGCAVVWQDKLWLLYTGFTENGGGENIRQVQCLASSEDGVHFEKHGVVIGESELPDAYHPADFRDPKVWKNGEHFYCFVAARRREGRGRLLAFRSTDLKNWTFVGDLFGQDCKGNGMVECPDYLPEKGLLFTSEQFSPREGNTHLNVHTTRWYVGDFDESTGEFKAKKEGIVDYGFDFYAPQTIAHDGVMIAWMNMWDRNVPSEKYGFSGMLTVPRRVDVRDGELYQYPVISGETVVARQVNERLTDEATIGVLKIRAEDLSEFCLKLRKKDDQYAELRLSGEEWIFDRSRAGELIKGVETDELSLGGKRSMPYRKQGETEITVVMDRFSLEFFIDGRALTATVYPSADANGVELTMKATSCRYVRLKADGSVACEK